MAAGLPRLCVDIDNVIALTDRVIRELILDHTGGRVQYQYEHIQEFKYQECVDANGNRITDSEWAEVLGRFSTPDVLAEVSADKAGLSALEHLAGQFEIVIVTSREPQGQSATFAWLKKHAVPYDDVKFVAPGKKHVAVEPFFAAVEDDYKQAKGFAEVGTLALLIRHPWNATKSPANRIKWVDDWNGAVQVLEAELAGRPTAGN